MALHCREGAGERTVPKHWLATRLRSPISSAKCRTKPNVLTIKQPRRDPMQREQIPHRTIVGQGRGGEHEEGSGCRATHGEGLVARIGLTKRACARPSSGACRRSSHQSQHRVVLSGTRCGGGSERDGSGDDCRFCRCGACRITCGARPGTTWISYCAVARAGRIAAFG